MQLMVVDRQREHARIEFALAQLAQHLLGLFLDQQQLEAWEPRTNLRNHVRQQVRPEGREDAEPDRARFRIDRAPRDRADLLDLVEHLACALRDLAADLGQQHLARSALDQGHAEFLLELANLGRQGRLAHATRFRGTAEMAVLGERDEIAQVTEVHGSCIDNNYESYDNNQLE